ncbi:hypothetical protein CORAM0001_0145 [Corynebacterium amycolatum SK46]|nr:hypothetical protein CORAM0001_0145 [Corynebacterium amycolatum SK46]
MLLGRATVPSNVGETREIGLEVIAPAYNDVETNMGTGLLATMLVG